jgi:hypothetical protein
MMQYNLVAKMDMIRVEHEQYSSELARFSNEVLLVKAYWNVFMFPVVHWLLQFSVFRWQPLHQPHGLIHKIVS